MSQVIKKYMLATSVFSNPDLLDKCIKSWPREKESQISKYFKAEIDTAIILDGQEAEENFEEYIINSEQIKDIDYVIYGSLQSGCAAVWNKILSYSFKNGYDRVIIVGSDTEFIDNFIYDFILEYEKRNLDIATHNGFNCFIMNKKCFDIVGKFDENFFPMYYEDEDYIFRVHKNDDINFRGIMVDSTLFKHFNSAVIKRNEKYNFMNDKTHEMNKQYYINKWGGEPGEEKYNIPFNKNPLDYWKIDEIELREKRNIWIK